MDSVRAFLSANGVKLKKELGQNFLADEQVLAAIVGAAALQPTDHVVEIGPGIGVLTKELLARVATVTAIELDATLTELLKTYTGHHPNLTIIQGNALQTLMPNEPYKIVANIPYHITSPLLRHVFLESSVKPSSMTLLIQREVAEKICDTKKAGMLTILVGLFGTPKLITIVPPESFIPPPKVDSAVLHIDCYEQSRAEPALLEQIFRLTKLCFGQKRKMLRNTLGSQPGGDDAMAAAGIEVTRRPESLSIDEWISLARSMGTENGEMASIS